MLKRFLSFLFLMLWLLPARAIEGEEGVEKLRQYAENIVAFNAAHPQEKVYLHMDNRSYFVGDTIFFKAYVLHAGAHRLANISRVLYVELLGDRKSVV